MNDPYLKLGKDKIYTSVDQDFIEKVEDLNCSKMKNWIRDKDNFVLKSEIEAYKDDFYEM